MPDESVLLFVESELKASGRLNGFSAFTYVNALQRRGVTPAERAALRLALAMYGERVDPAARDLFREVIDAVPAGGESAGRLPHPSGGQDVPKVRA